VAKSSISLSQKPDRLHTKDYTVCICKKKLKLTYAVSKQHTLQKENTSDVNIYKK